MADLFGEICAFRVALQSGCYIRLKDDESSLRDFRWHPGLQPFCTNNRVRA
jgi:hypothetical protein